MGSTTARSAMQKNSSEALAATGRYSSRVASISLSVASASATLADTSSAVTWGKRKQGGVRSWVEAAGCWLASGWLAMLGAALGPGCVCASSCQNSRPCL